MATGQSSTVGVVVHDIADPYFSSIAAGLIEVAYARGLLVCMSSTAAGEAGEREYVSLMRAQRARAVILIGSRSDDVAGPRRAGRRDQRLHPLRRPGRLRRPGPARRGHDHAGERGRRRGAGPRPGRARAPQLRRAGRPARPAHRAGPAGRLRRRAGRLVGGPGPARRGARRVHQGRRLRGDERAAGGRSVPDCVFAVNDVMAVGALARLRAAGLAVPADIAVAGFDDISPCATSTRR